MITPVDKLLIFGSTLGAVMLIGCLVGAYFYDPDIEIAPGRKMPRSLLQKMDYMITIGSDGKAYEWPRPRA